MTKIQNSKQYDLEDHTLAFAKRVRGLVKRLPKTLVNVANGDRQDLEREASELTSIFGSILTKRK
jgi:hypothetical protein